MEQNCNCYDSAFNFFFFTGVTAFALVYKLK